MSTTPPPSPSQSGRRASDPRPVTASTGARGDDDDGRDYAYEVAPAPAGWPRRRAFIWLLAAASVALLGVAVSLLTDSGQVLWKGRNGGASVLEGVDVDSKDDPLSAPKNSLHSDFVRDVIVPAWLGRGVTPVFSVTDIDYGEGGEGVATSPRLKQKPEHAEDGGEDICSPPGTEPWCMGAPLSERGITKKHPLFAAQKDLSKFPLELSPLHFNEAVKGPLKKHSKEHYKIGIEENIILPARSPWINVFEVRQDNDKEEATQICSLGNRAWIYWLFRVEFDEVLADIVGEDLDEPMEVDTTATLLDDGEFWEDELVDPVCFELLKDGYSTNIGRRCHHYRTGLKEGTSEPLYPHFDRNYRMVGAVSWDQISKRVDARLTASHLKFIKAVINGRGVPEGMKWLYKKLLPVEHHADGRAWHVGGPKKNMGMQLMEFALAANENLPRPGEAFMWDDAKHKFLRKRGLDISRVIIGLMMPYLPEKARAEDGEADDKKSTVEEGVDVIVLGRYVFFIGSWKTGAKEERLSSFVTSVEYVVGGPVPSARWDDVIKVALFPNAKTEEEIFAYNFSPGQLDKADDDFCCLIRFHSMLAQLAGGGVIFVDAQNYMYGNLIMPQLVIESRGFHRVGTVLGSHIIIFQRGKVFILLVGHVAIAGDSRKEISHVERQRMATVVDILRHVRRWVEGDIASDSDDFHDRAIRGAMAAEVNDRGWHANRRFGAAMYRDSVTPSDVNAIELFGGGKTPNEFEYPTSERARELARAGLRGQDNKFDRHLMVNLFATTPQNGLISTLDRLKSEINLLSKDAVLKTWRRIVNDYLAPVEQGGLVDRIRKWTKTKKINLEVIDSRTDAAKAENLRLVQAVKDGYDPDKVNFFWIVPDSESASIVSMKEMTDEDLLADNLSETSTDGHSLPVYRIIHERLKRAVSNGGVEWAVKKGLKGDYALFGQTKGKTGKLILLKYTHSKNKFFCKKRTTSEPKSE